MYNKKEGIQNGVNSNIQVVGAKVGFKCNSRILSDIKLTGFQLNKNSIRKNMLILFSLLLPNIKFLNISQGFDYF